MRANNGRQIQVGDLVSGTSKEGQRVTGIVLRGKYIPAIKETKDGKEIEVAPECHELTVCPIPTNWTVNLVDINVLKTEDIDYQPVTDQPPRPVAPPPPLPSGGQIPPVQ